MIIYSGDSGVVDLPEDHYHDPDSKIFYRLDYRPQFRRSSQYYIKGLDTVIPNTPNGCMYECISGGITADLEPSLPTLESKTVDDGTVKWKILPYTAKLWYGDIITSSTWVASQGVTLENSLISGGSTTFVKVTSVPPTSKFFTITNHIVILRASGLQEEYEKTLRVKVAQL